MVQEIMTKEFEKLRAKIIARAWKDPHYKEKLLKNPKAALKEMGWDLPETFSVKVVEEKQNSFTFVLPPAMSLTKELTEAELEKMAAGAAAGDTMAVSCYAPAVTFPACCPG